MSHRRTVAERSIPLEGAFNVRDLGGLPAGDGRAVRSGLIFRADSPRRLSASDRATVEAMRLSHVVDLRTGHEASLGSWAVTDATRTSYYEVIDALPDPDKPDADLPPVITHDVIAERYAHRAEATTALFAAAVETVVRAAPARVLFHCTAGKDRTGIVAAALLLMLDVPRAEIVHDYALSTPNVHRKIAHLRQHPLPGDPPFDRLPPMAAEAPAEVMDRFLAIMDERHGGLVALLVRHGLDAAVVTPFRSLMLVDAD